MSKDKAALYDIVQAAEDVMRAMHQVSFAELSLNRENKPQSCTFLL